MVRLWYAIGLALILIGLFHLGVLAIDGGPWEGPVSWRKPFTFGVSFGLSVLTLAWVAQFVPLRGRARNVLLGVFTGAAVTECALITLQAWRGVPSHFNMASTVDSLVSRALAAGGGALVVVAIWLTVASFRPNPGVSPSMRLAVRAGFATLLASMLSGAVMIARGVIEVYSGDQQLAYTVATSLKPAHAVLMHGVLLLPALAWLSERLLTTEAARLRLVRLATCTYVAIAALVSALTVTGITLVGPSTASVLCAGAISTLAITALALRRVEARPPGGSRRTR
ncbi:hypothetical protein ABZ297_10930 [Nonomuraea sp. NPDC005983]|uniref:hypothetical protein n=1 Tax=Nonomuraea sp. NPDC005983 TaxID=3155595 RepID=UPI0033A9023B